MDRQEGHNVDRIFAGRLRDARVKAPETVWSGIASAMENDRLRRKVLYARLTAAASLLLLLGFGMWFMLTGSNRGPAMVDVMVQSGNPVKSAHRDDQIITVDADEVPCPETDGTQATFAHSGRPQKSAVQKQGSRLPQTISTWSLTTRPVHLTASAADGLALSMRDAGSMEELYPKAQPVAPFFPLMPDLRQPDNTSPLQVNPAIQEIIAKAEDNDEDEGEGRSRNFSLGGTAAPDFAFASQTPVALAKINQYGKKALPDDATSAARTNSPTVAMTTGMRVNYDVSERLSLQTGLLYTRRVTNQEHALFTNLGQVEAVETNFNLHYLEVPATVRYNVIHKRKLDYYVGTGFSTNLFIQYSNFLTAEESSNVIQRRVSERDKILTPAQANVLLSTGIQYRLHDKLSLNLEPGVRYGFYTNDYAFSQSKPVSMSALTGINYHF